MSGHYSGNSFSSKVIHMEFCSVHDVCRQSFWASVTAPLKRDIVTPEADMEEAGVRNHGICCLCCCLDVKIGNTLINTLKNICALYRDREKRTKFILLFLFI